MEQMNPAHENGNMKHFVSYKDMKAQAKIDLDKMKADLDKLCEHIDAISKNIDNVTDRAYVRCDTRNIHEVTNIVAFATEAQALCRDLKRLQERFSQPRSRLDNFPG